jgi:hypothetical protein
MVEVGRYSNHADQGECLQGLIEISSSSRLKPKTRTAKQVHRRLQPDERDEMVVGYRKGLTIYELAQRFQIHRNTVSDLLERRGVPRRYQSLSSAQIGKAIKQYSAGDSLATVGRSLGCDPNTVRLALIAADVPRRDTHGRAVE